VDMNNLGSVQSERQKINASSNYEIA